MRAIVAEVVPHQRRFVSRHALGSLPQVLADRKARGGEGGFTPCECGLFVGAESAPGAPDYVGLTPISNEGSRARGLESRALSLTTIEQPAASPGPILLTASTTGNTGHARPTAAVRCFLKVAT